MSLFDERQREWLAARIRELPLTLIDASNPNSQTIRDAVARKLARDLQTDDPRFDVARFLEACGFASEAR